GDGVGTVLERVPEDDRVVALALVRRLDEVLDGDGDLEDVPRVPGGGLGELDAVGLVAELAQVREHQAAAAADVEHGAAGHAVVQDARATPAEPADEPLEERVEAHV